MCAQGHSQRPWHPFLHPSIQALQTGAGTSLPGTDTHTAWSCPRPESSKLRERQYGISLHSHAIQLSPFLTLHIFLLKLTPLLAGKQQPGTPADEAWTLSPLSFFFLFLTVCFDLSDILSLLSVPDFLHLGTDFEQAVSVEAVQRQHGGAAATPQPAIQADGGGG